MRKNKRGASLVLVLMLMAFVMVIGLGVVTLANTSSNQTSVNLTQRQADLTAQSVLDSVVAKIQDGTINPATSTSPVTGSDSHLGSYTYQISASSVGANCYKIYVDASYPNSSGAHAKMNRIIQKTGSSFSGFALTTSTTVASSIVSQNYGDMAINNDFTMHNDGYYYGNVDINGSLNLTNGQFYVLPDPSDNQPVNIHIAKDLTASSTGGNFNATVYVGGNVNVQSTGFNINGDMYVNGNVYMSGMTSYKGNIYCKGTVQLINCSSIIGNIDAGGAVTLSGSTFSGTTKQNDSTVAAKIPAVTENISAPLATIPTISGTLTADFSKQNSYTFTTGGYLTMSNFQWVNTGTSNDGDKLILNASSQDLYISLATPSTTSGSTIYLDSQADLLTNYSDSNPHNIYLYLSDNAGTKYVNLDITNTGDNFVGDQAYYNSLVGLSNPAPEKRAPNLYIISNGPSAVTLEGNGVMYAYIYAPKGTASFSSSTPFWGATVPQFTGAIVASSVNFSGAPNLEQYYPSGVQIGSGSGGSGGSWSTLGTYAGAGS